VTSQICRTVNAAQTAENLAQLNEITSRFTIHRLLEVASRGALPISIELQRATNAGAAVHWPRADHLANPQSAGKTGVLSVACVESCVSSVQPPLIHLFCV